MARIDKASKFHPVSRSADGSSLSDPWRDFISSIAVKFTSWRRCGWSTDSIEPETQAAIIKAIEARNSVALAEMKLLSALRDFVRTQSTVTHGHSAASPLMLSDDQVLARVRKILLSNSLPSSHSLSKVFAELDAHWRELSLVAKGFIEIAETRRGPVEMIFTLGRRIIFDPGRFPAVALTLCAVADRAAAEFGATEKA